MPEEVIYRCIDANCARTLPRPVKFCPYCGAAQQTGADNPALAKVEAVRPAVIPAPAAIAQPMPPGEPVQRVAPVSAPAEPRVAVPAPPPQREPVRLRYWLLALALLGMVWLYAKPSAKKVDARIDRAIALSAECKFNEAQNELIALRSANATPEQLDRLQAAINEAVPACDKKRLRAERQRCVASGRKWIGERCR